MNQARCIGGQLDGATIDATPRAGAIYRWMDHTYVCREWYGTLVWLCCDTLKSEQEIVRHLVDGYRPKRSVEHVRELLRSYDMAQADVYRAQFADRQDVADRDRTEAMRTVEHVVESLR